MTAFRKDLKSKFVDNSFPLANVKNTSILQKNNYNSNSTCVQRKIFEALYTLVRFMLQIGRFYTLEKLGYIDICKFFNYD